MADSSMDLAAANRFISSLSKSLQALCHGCMDFDAGIEIVGYINVNIDSGSKVDYVLNEKVLKSTTNSMTFVSNSFLAKKDQPKQCRDGSCSPILELNQPPPPTFPHRTRGGYSYPASQHYRSSGIYSPHSQILRGSQKRAWSGPERDWRASPRKHPRDVRPPHNMLSQQSSQGGLESSSSNSAPPNSHFLSSQPDAEKADQHTELNIKKELVEDQNTGSEDSSNQINTNKENGADSGTFPENVNVKQDPDSLPSQDGVSKFENSTEALSQADLSSSFLQQPETDGGDTKADNSGKTKPEPASIDDGNITFGNVGESSGGSDVQGEQNYANDPNNTGAGEGGEESLGMDADYEGAGEDMFSQPSFSGEGSSGGGQFEVIEIDDEDEDVQAMFNEAHYTLPQDNYQKRQRSISPDNIGINLLHQFQDFTETYPFPQPDNFSPSMELPNYDGSNSNVLQCRLCGHLSSDPRELKAHYKQIHHYFSPFLCHICYRCFETRRGFRQHQQCHGGRSFKCQNCGAGFKFKHHLKRHMFVHSTSVVSAGTVRSGAVNDERI